MTQTLYLHDSYLRMCEARVVSADGMNIVLDTTVFYPTNGGQPHDVGFLRNGSETYKVLAVQKSPSGIVHQLDREGLRVGDVVTAEIDWDRRYRLMRYHTAMHLVTAVLHAKTGALITGNQIDVDKSRVDFDLEIFDRTILEQCIIEANTIIQQDLPILVSFMKKEDALTDSSLIKLAATDFLEKLGSEIRIIEIQGIDKQLDGGTHVRSLKEIGQLQLVKLENKGKARRRLYFSVKP